MNERIEEYRAWKSANYGVDPNEVNQINEMKNNIDMKNRNVGLNLVEGNIRGNSVISDYRNNGFNIGNNNLD